MHTVSITGEAGLIKWGYIEAAQLASWSIDGDRLSAKVVSSDDDRVSQAPLLFVVPRPVTDWVWNIVTLQITGSTLTAVLAP